MNHTKDLLQRFEDIYGYPTENLYFSPGRINLIGEHTDYNGGKVLPCAITMGTYAVVAPREDKMVYAFSDNLPELGTLSFSLEGIAYEKESSWTNYIKGMLLRSEEHTSEL